jgi:hypothetical protein
MVVDPDRRDVKERGQVRDVGRPLPDQNLDELAAGAAGRMQVQHEQGQGNREDAVAERLDAGALRQAQRLRILVGHASYITEDHVAHRQGNADARRRDSSRARRVASAKQAG